MLGELYPIGVEIAHRSLFSYNELKIAHVTSEYFLISNFNKMLKLKRADKFSYDNLLIYIPI